jgi:uncharacterized damage-inducible protein DinB
MPETLLDALLDCWDRSNTIVLNLVKAIPKGGLHARVMQGSPSASEMLTHMHHERMVSLLEEAPEFAGQVPDKEWMVEHDTQRIAEMFAESARRVREAVKGRVESGRALELHYDHPILLLQLLMFHEAYHHGQIKLALKAAGCPLPDDQAGPLTWDVWRKKAQI